jgi:cation:H+ antiporter
MTPILAIPLFLASAALTFVAAGFFADKLDHIGPRLGLPEAAVGLLTAFAADTPEISSAIVALVAGKRDASLGVVLGSNVFNLAAMLGLGAVAAGAVVVNRDALLIEGAVSIVAFLVACGLILGLFPAWVALAILLAVILPYLVVRTRRAPRPNVPHDYLERGAIRRPAMLIVPAVILIVLGSTGMVKAALALADRWHVSQTVTGFLVLAVLTSLPNAFTAVRLARAGRGDAVVTETLASNTLNLIGGIVVPALFVGIAARSGDLELDLAWLAGLTAIALVALVPGRGLGRRTGMLLVAGYIAFVALQLAIS